MAVVPLSQLQLNRAYRELSAALVNQDWAQIAALDESLIDALIAAGDDPHGDRAVLLQELEHIILLYRRLLSTCQEQVNHLASRNAEQAHLSLV